MVFPSLLPFSIFRISLSDAAVQFRRHRCIHWGSPFPSAVLPNTFLRFLLALVSPIITFFAFPPFLLGIGAVFWFSVYHFCSAYCIFPAVAGRSKRRSICLCPASQTQIQGLTLSLSFLDLEGGFFTSLYFVNFG